MSSNSAATCYVCGHDAGDNWFDRTLCACDTMHTRCCNCGAALDDCPYEQVEPHAIPNSEANTSRSADRANAAEPGQGEAGYDPGLTTRNVVADPILPPYDVLRAMAGQVMAEFGPDVCGADIVSALTARECQEWLRGLRDG